MAQIQSWTSTNIFIYWTLDKSILTKKKKKLWVLSKNSWLLTRQLARSIMLHADSGCCVSICTACCLPVWNYWVLGGDSKRQGCSDIGCYCSPFQGRTYFLFSALTVSDHVGFQPTSSLLKSFSVTNTWPTDPMTFTCPHAVSTHAFSFCPAFCGCFLHF